MINFLVDLNINIYRVNEDLNEFWCVVIQPIGEKYDRQIIYIQKTSNTYMSMVNAFIKENLMEILKLKKYSRIRLTN